MSEVKNVLESYSNAKLNACKKIAEIIVEKMDRDYLSRKQEATFQEFASGTDQCHIRLHQDNHVVRLETPELQDHPFGFDLLSELKNAWLLIREPNHFPIRKLCANILDELKNNDKIDEVIATNAEGFPMYVKYRIGNDWKVYSAMTSEECRTFLAEHLTDIFKVKFQDRKRKRESE